MLVAYVALRAQHNAVILFILWILGFFIVHVGGGLIHLLLVIAVIVVVYRLVTGRPVV
jgi:hypothetical protein